MENPEFLRQKYHNLHVTSPVKSAERRKNILNKKVGNAERVSQNPNKQIQNYLDRLEKIVLDPEHKQKRKNMGDKENTERSRALSLIRTMIMNEYVRPNKEKLAQGAAIVEERAARQMGINMEYGEEQLAERGEIAVKDLEGSLDQWISYLSDLNEPYPMWFRYYAFRNILDLGEYDKDKGEFPTRTAGTNRLFPDIDRGALARIQDIIECSKDPTQLERFRNAQRTTETPEDQLLTAEKAKAFANLSFAKQYAESIEESGEITPEMRAETRGKWIKYSQDSDPTALWASLQNKGTAWCTKGFATAETQLKGGDFYVYYTLDKTGKPKIPRIAIRMQEGRISEARGVADSKQNLEGNMAEIADKKMSELPGKEKYQKTSSDMKRMTSIYEKSFKEDRKTGEKTYLNPELSKDELVFLYEIESKIEGFGYEKDPRVKELREKRNPKEDAPAVFGCEPNQIAWKKDEITANTKAYIGALFPGIFNLNVEHLYTTFPETKIQKSDLEIGGKKSEELKKELLTKGFKISPDAEYMMDSEEFTTLENKEKIRLVRLKVKDLGFENGATTDQIYEKAKNLGLELCPPEVGPYQRLKDTKQSLGEWYRIAMKQIAVRHGRPGVFDVERHVDGLWLRNNWAFRTNEWNPGSEFLFRLGKET